MATTVKTWVFLADSEGLVDAGNSASLNFSWLGTDGNPLGCVRFTQTTMNSGTQIERAYRPATGQTWETFGVPAGATVTAVQITAWDERLVNNSKLSSHSIIMRIVNSALATVHSAGDLISTSLGTSVDATWQAGV